jgi:TrmH family RNA methyltransferase
MSAAGPDLVARFRAARADRGLAVLEGFHALKHALRFRAAIELAVAHDPDSVLRLADDLAPDLLTRLQTCLVAVSARDFARLAPVPPATGVLALARRPPVDPAQLLGRPADAPLIFLENPGDLGNIGAVVRVAAAAGAAAVLTTGRHDPWHPVALRGSAGLHFALPVAALPMLPPATPCLIAVHPDGASLDGASIPTGSVLAFGAERAGLSLALLARADRRLAIPMRPGVSSLNLATAVAVALYAWRMAPCHARR